MIIELNSIEYDCWHEAGHAFVCLLLGGNVQLIEIIEKNTSKGRARARCEINERIRRYVACGGLAAEYFLYITHKLNASESQFIKNALTQAFLDKQSYFNGDFEKANGYWPATMDKEFRDFAINEVFPILKKANAFPKMEKIVNALLKKKRVDNIQLIELIEEHKNRLRSNRNSLSFISVFRKVFSSFILFLPSRLFRWVKRFL